MEYILSSTAGKGWIGIGGGLRVTIRRRNKHAGLIYSIQHDICSDRLSSAPRR